MGVYFKRINNEIRMFQIKLISNSKTSGPEILGFLKT